MGDFGYILGIYCFFAFLIGILTGWLSRKHDADPEAREPERTEIKRPVTQEDMRVVLEYMMVGASPYEKTVIGAILDMIEKGESDEE